jgi:hypothetical protein
MSFIGWENIYDNTLTEAATSVTISSLSGNQDIEYKLEARVVNGYGRSIDVKTQLNADTGSNYGYQQLYGNNATAGASRNTSTTGTSPCNIASGNRGMFQDIIYAKSGYIRTGIQEDVDNINTTTIATTVIRGWSWNNTADEITSLVILADQANGLGVGTNIRLWRRASLSVPITFIPRIMFIL